MLINELETLSENQERFFEMLKAFEDLAEYWSEERVFLDIKGLEKDIPSMDPQSAAIARFLGGLWLGENYYQFDVYKHLVEMSELGQLIFKGWVEEPFVL